MVRYGMVRYGMVRYGMVWYGTVRYGSIRYGTVQYGSVRCGTSSMPSTILVRYEYGKSTVRVRSISYGVLFSTGYAYNSEELL